MLLLFTIGAEKACQVQLAENKSSSEKDQTCSVDLKKAQFDNYIIMPSFQYQGQKKRWSLPPAPFLKFALHHKKCEAQ